MGAKVPVSGWTRKKSTLLATEGLPKKAKTSKKSHKLVGKTGRVRKVTKKSVKGRQIQVVKIQFEGHSVWVRSESRVRTNDRVRVKAIKGQTKGKIMKVTLTVLESDSPSSDSSWESSWDGRDSWVHGSAGNKRSKRDAPQTRNVPRYVRVVAPL